MGNVVSGNTNNGNNYAVWLWNDADNNVVSGNIIGRNATNTADVGNGKTGVEIESGSDNNRIGGTTAAEGNVIAGNGYGAAGWYIGGVGVYGGSVDNSIIATQFSETIGWASTSQRTE